MDKESAARTRVCNWHPLRAGLCIDYPHIWLFQRPAATQNAAEVSIDRALTVRTMRGSRVKSRRHITSNSPHFFGADTYRNKSAPGGKNFLHLLEVTKFGGKRWLYIRTLPVFVPAADDDCFPRLFRKLVQHSFGRHQVLTKLRNRT